VSSEQILPRIEQQFIKPAGSIFTEIIRNAISDAYKRLIAPSIEREIRNLLSEKADDHAINVFATNLKNLLLQPPIKNKIIMGIDPGFRTGCKVAVIDRTGKYLEGTTIYPHPPENRVFESKGAVRKLIDQFKVDVVAIGNGTASRETEIFMAELIKEIKQEDDRNIYYTIVNEAGASVYSASKIAQKEFPNLDASMRGNISIARRLLDPLAELVKIDPKSIGVGLYQHDVDQHKLSETLTSVVESAVNLVGVNVNTASASLLKYISGLTGKTAENIIKYREEKGIFHSRDQLIQVPGLGEVAYQQAAGFLRIPAGDNPLDNTPIHPESYVATRNLLEQFHILDNRTDWPNLRSSITKLDTTLDKLADELGIGGPTLEDILISLEKPGRDPREDFVKPALRSDIMKLEDLHEGMTLEGIIRNVVDFGAFVDIGLKRDGLIHVSEMAEKFVKNPYKIVSVGDLVKVKVIRIDLEKERVNLSLKI
jgi:uncharacterized protein